METKTYVFGDGSGSGNSGMWGWLANLAQNRGVDPNVLAMVSYQRLKCVGFRRR